MYVNIRNIGLKEDSAIDSLVQCVGNVIGGIDSIGKEARDSEIARYSSCSIGKTILDNSGIVVVAEVGRDVIGFSLGYFNDGVYWLTWYGVRREFRSQGIGSRLLGFTERSARDRKLHKIWCSCCVMNMVSADILEKNGYIKLCTLSNHWYKENYYLFEKFL